MFQVQSRRFGFVFVFIIVQGFVVESRNSDLTVSVQEFIDGWKKITKTSCYKHEEHGIPKICWKAFARPNSTDIIINCTLSGVTGSTELHVYVDETSLGSCNNRRQIAGNNRSGTILSCSTLVPQADRYASKNFSCRFIKESIKHVKNIFTLLDNGVPSTPIVALNDSQLTCMAEKPRSGSLLELIDGNGDILKWNNHTTGNSLQVQYAFSESVNETVSCRHKYLSGKWSEKKIDVDVTTQQDEERRDQDDHLQLIIYGIIAIVLCSVICLLIYACCRFSKKRKEKLISPESSSEGNVCCENRMNIQDIYATPVPRNEREINCDYAVPVPKPRRKVTEEYAMVVPKNRRPNYAEPAYRDPWDLQPALDPVYMDIGSALYASISGSHHYDEVGSSNNSNKLDEVQYASLAEFPCYANSDTIHGNGSTENTSDATYATTKKAKLPKPMPKPRLKPSGAGCYVEMR